MNPTNDADEFPKSLEGSRAPETPPEKPAEKPAEKPIVGYCRATGKALNASEAVYLNGILYSKDYAEQAKIKDEAASPYTAPNPPMGSDPASASGVSPGLAFLLGLIPGVGAIYNGQYAKGLVHIVILGLLATLADNHQRGTGPLFGFLITGWIAYMAFEAYHTAQKRQRGEKTSEMSGLVDLPASLNQLPIGPLVLIFAGVVFLLDNLGLLPIEQFARFWPVLLIAAGVALLVQRLNPGVSPVVNPSYENKTGAAGSDHAN